MNYSETEIIEIMTLRSQRWELLSRFGKTQATKKDYERYDQIKKKLYQLTNQFIYK